MRPEIWRINRERAVDYLNTRDRIYVVDGFAGWDERYRLNIRVVCARAYHALFMRTMLIRPTQEELKHFHPDYVIYNAGTFSANRYTEGMTSATSVAINFGEKEMVILGTEYAGEMKKGILTVFFYEMPVKHSVLTLHSSANVGEAGDVTLFIGLTGTGKTTLSVDRRRKLIGDDEHCWSDQGVFNVEGGITTEQTMYHFISGYTSKVVGVNEGIMKYQASFSSCFGQQFLALHPMRYARMLAEKIAKHKANAWLLNTGWVGASASKGGERCPLKYTRAILDAIHSGELVKSKFEAFGTFNLYIPTSVTGVPPQILNPRRSWKAGEVDFGVEVTNLAKLFVENFKKYEDEAGPDVVSAGEWKYQIGTDSRLVWRA
ncbi:hypothetical protein GP486_001488 [Trichoglossum hirsutum]|uniref:Phosphoenolpyruvate carboxykinase (ATP) n=1 Tax=Trichoglossum hirsutum TaxID=265104 RepID=A0A9P8LG02_9PEZI|nr:hypothetical protein GP486_001488 [Trichoglossum hirsutum]